MLTDPATGLPAMTSPATAQAIQPSIVGVPQEFIQHREHYKFELPKDAVPANWGRVDADRFFALTPLSATEEEAAMRAAGQNGVFDGGMLSKHWMLSSVYAIGGAYTGRNFDKITEWREAIGPKGRKFLDLAFGHLHNISEKQGEDFLAGMQRAG